MRAFGRWTRGRVVIFRVTRTSIYNDRQPCLEAVRPKSGEGWVVEIDTLDDLIAFVRPERNGTCIVGTYSDGPYIEIYDDYRE